MIAEPFSPERFERFHNFVKLTPAPPGLNHLGECWLWTGYIDKDGYGRFRCPGFPTIDGSPKKSPIMLAHRWCIAFWYGTKTLHRLTYDHLCRRKACVNPRHGSAITLSENTIRGNVMRHEYQPEDPFEALGI